MRSLERLVSEADFGILQREGLRIAIIGPPNAGKSSLLNRLLGQERAIVTPVAGTARDTITEGANLLGLPVQLIDTADCGDRALRLNVSAYSAPTLPPRRRTSSCWSSDGSRPARPDDAAFLASCPAGRTGTSS